MITSFFLLENTIRVNNPVRTKSTTKLITWHNLLNWEQIILEVCIIEISGYRTKFVIVQPIAKSVGDDLKNTINFASVSIPF